MFKLILIFIVVFILYILFGGGIFILYIGLVLVLACCWLLFWMIVTYVKKLRERSFLNKALYVPLVNGDEPAGSDQIEQLRELGIDISKESLTRQQAWDLLYEKTPVDESDAEVLRFFGENPKNYSSQLAKLTVQMLLSDPYNRNKWENKGSSKSF